MVTFPVTLNDEISKFVQSLGECTVSLHDKNGDKIQSACGQLNRISELFVVQDDRTNIILAFDISQILGINLDKHIYIKESK